MGARSSEETVAVQDLTIFDFMHDVLIGGSADRQSQPIPTRRCAGDAFPAGDRRGHGEGRRDTGSIVFRLCTKRGRRRSRRFGMSVAAFHHLMQDRARSWPRAMVTTATHDTKRGRTAAALGAIVRDAERWEGG